MTKSDCGNQPIQGHDVCKYCATQTPIYTPPPMPKVAPAKSPRDEAFSNSNEIVASINLDTKVARLNDELAELTKKMASAQFYTKIVPVIPVKRASLMKLIKKVVRLKSERDAVATKFAKKVARAKLETKATDLEINTAAVSTKLANNNGEG